MNLRFHTDPSAFYDQSGNLYPEPIETLEELEVKLNESCEQLKSLPKPKPANEYSDDDDDLFFDLGIAEVQPLQFYRKSRMEDRFETFLCKKLPFGLNFWCVFVIYKCTNNLSNEIRHPYRVKKHAFCRT